jgi:uncharacterized membrane protein YcjF (UPF0283 family)
MRSLSASSKEAILLLISFVLGVFSAAGYLQAGMLQSAGYRTAAWVYLGLLVLSAIGIVAVIGALVRQALRRNSKRPAI